GDICTSTITCDSSVCDSAWSDGHLMFVGHFALGFAAKRVTPRVSLAALFAAAQFADLLWPVLLAFGLEQVRIDPGNTAFTPLAYFANVLGGAPPSVVALYSGAIAGSIVLMLWSWWLDRHREPANLM